jgi:LemA protein
MMKKGWLAGCIVIAAVFAVILFFGLWFWGIYNSMATKNVAIDQQWGQVEAQYQRRYDLVPNLVAATKGYLKQEQTVFQMITDARTKYAGAATPDEKVAAANELETALGRLLAIIEDNPEIKSNQVVSDLMFELAGTENRISVERMRYNEKVGIYNTTVKTFPGRLLAGMFGFNERPFFEAQEGAETAPEVDLDVNP